jgi:hypothetical protein
MRTQTRDEQTKRAVSTENADEEGRKHTPTGDEEGLQRESVIIRKMTRCLICLICLGTGT